MISIFSFGVTSLVFFSFEVEISLAVLVVVLAVALVVVFLVLDSLVVFLVFVSSFVALASVFTALVSILLPDKT